MTSQQLHDAMNYLPDDLIEETDRRRNAPRHIIPFRRYAAFAASFALVLCSVWFCTRLFSPKGATEEAAIGAPAALYSVDSATDESAMQGAAPEAEIAAAPMETRSANSSDKKSEATEEVGEDAPAENGVTGNTATEKAGFIGQSVETPRVTSGTACYTSAPRITLIRTSSELEEYLNHYSYQYHFDAVGEAISGYDSGWFETHDLLLLAIHTVPTGSTCQITSVTEADGIWEIHIAHEPFNPEKPDTTDYHLLLTTEKDQIPSKDAVVLFFE